MGRRISVTRDAQGKVVSSTEVRSTSGCGGCFYVLLGVLAVVGPAAWAGNGEIPVAAAVVMYVVEVLVIVAAVAHQLRRRSGNR